MKIAVDQLTFVQQLLANLVGHSGRLWYSAFLIKNELGRAVLWAWRSVKPIGNASSLIARAFRPPLFGITIVSLIRPQ
jgi:hypothetical protein